MLKMWQKVAIGVGALGVTGLILWPKVSKAATGPATGPGIPSTPPKVDHPEDFAQGLKDGGVDGSTDGATCTTKKPHPKMSYSSDMLRQANYEKGYNSAYGSAYDIACTTSKFGMVTEPPKDGKVGPKGGEVPVATVETYKNSGYNIGYKDGVAAYDMGAGPGSGHPVAPTSNPIYRDAFNTGYERGFSDGFRAEEAKAHAAGAYVGAPMSGNFGGGVMSQTWSSWFPTYFPTYATMPNLNYSDGCYKWGFARGQEDAQAGRPADGNIVGHSDIDRSPIPAYQRAACADAIQRGYSDGYRAGSLSYGSVPYSSYFSRYFNWMPTQNMPTQNMPMGGMSVSPGAAPAPAAPPGNPGVRGTAMVGQTMADRATGFVRRMGRGMKNRMSAGMRSY